MFLNVEDKFQYCLFGQTRQNRCSFWTKQTDGHACLDKCTRHVICVLLKNFTQHFCFYILSVVIELLWHGITTSGVAVDMNACGAQIRWGAHKHGGTDVDRGADSIMDVDRYPATFMPECRVYKLRLTLLPTWRLCGTWLLTKWRLHE